MPSVGDTRGTLAGKLSLASLGLLCSLAAGFLYPQASAPSFDAASVKAVAANSNEGRRNLFTPGRYRGSRVTLQRLIETAYQLQDYQVRGGPEWVRSETFDVTAVTEGATPVPEMRAMLQTLLASRFALKVQRASPDGVVYYLLAGPQEEKLEHYKDTGRIPALPKNLPDGAHLVKFSYFVYRGGAATRTEMIRAREATMPELAAQLSIEVAAPVMDKTGLTLPYNFGLIYAPTPLEAAGGRGPEAAASANAPTLAAALDRQLGLKLQRGRGPVPTIRIVSATQPTVN